MLKWFLDEPTRKKIHMVRSFNDITEFIDKQHIPKVMVRELSSFSFLIEFFSLLLLVGASVLLRH
jgi:hypothetical protein